MASPEKVVIMAFAALIIIHATSMIATNEKATDRYEEYAALYQERHEELYSINQQSGQVQRVINTAQTRVEDFWDGVKMATGFLWLFATTPYMIAAGPQSAGLAESYLAGGLFIMETGLILLLVLNAYLIRANKKT